MNKTLGEELREIHAEYERERREKALQELKDIPYLKALPNYLRLEAKKNGSVSFTERYLAKYRVTPLQLRLWCEINDIRYFTIVNPGYSEETVIEF